MITKKEATNSHHGQILYHRWQRNTDGTPIRARVNGQCKTWKRDPYRWRLPVKHGLRNCFYIGTQSDCENPNEWYTQEYGWILENTPWQTSHPDGLYPKEWNTLGPIIADWLEEHGRSEDATILRANLI